MARKGEHRQIIQNGQSVDVIHTQYTDDYPLPTADELAKLKAIDPNIITFILDRAKDEQEARIEANNKKLSAVIEDMRHQQRYEYVKLIAAVILCVLLSWGSYSLIYAGYQIIGSAFGGAFVVVIIGMFLGVRKTKEDSTEEHSDK